jgi:23S rRNA (adenine1618-N6)-methyltransferase
LEYARNNVSLNKLQHRINVVARKPTDSLIPIDDLGMNSIDFVMNNPPFYRSEEEMTQSAANKSRPPFSACTGAKVDMVTEGGEVAFVDRILQESLVLRERVQWYTAMFGFLTSVVEFIEKLRKHDIDNYAVTEFVQGSKTRRWAVAWSFGSMRPSLEVARGIKTAVPKNILPEITEAEVITFPTPEKIGEFAEKFSTAVSKLDLISWEWNRERLEGVGRAADKVWTRQWRRRQKSKEMDGGKPKDEPDATEKKCFFAFKVSIHVGKDEVSVECRWVEGHEGFESFRGYLKTTALSLLK